MSVHMTVPLEDVAAFPDFLIRLRSGYIVGIGNQGP